MNAKLRFDKNDGEKEKSISGLSVIFRPGDTLVIGGRLYEVADAHYHIENNEATYWLNEGADEESLSASITEKDFDRSQNLFALKMGVGLILILGAFGVACYFFVKIYAK